MNVVVTLDAGDFFTCSAGSKVAARLAREKSRDKKVKYLSRAWTP